ncbi:MAG: YjbF family lipoprotein [Enterovibrio sp.]
MKLIRNYSYLYIILFSLTSGCSQKLDIVTDTAKAAFLSAPDVTLSNDHIKNSPYASIYAKLEGSPRAFMVLGFIEQSASAPIKRQSLQQLKWISANKEMIVTEAGRIVKTANFRAGNLLASYSDKPDPLALGLLDPKTPKTWQRQIDWTPGNNQGVIVESLFTAKGEQTITILDTKINTYYFTELITFVGKNKQFVNEYWLDKQSGRVLKSKQLITPALPPMTITELKSIISHEK